MLLVLIRAVFVLVVAAYGVKTAKIVVENQIANPYVLFIGFMLAAVAVVIADLLTPRKRIQLISAVFLGLVVGILLSNLLTNALQPTMQQTLHPRVHQTVEMIVSTFICYICISTLLNYIFFPIATKHDATLTITTKIRYTVFIVLLKFSCGYKISKLLMRRNNIFVNI